jgi:3-oxoacyl-(acyl-carrier-protein) synthase/thioesterase domain-containing protein/aryl carrier-like protein
VKDEADQAAGASRIAVIGMAGRFPGARDVSELWSNLRRGVESVRWFSDEELLAAGEAEEALRDPAYVKARPVLQGFDEYDAAFFGHSPRDAAVMDPQHRIFFEAAWEALESAGYGGARPGPVGVFAACGMNAYLLHHLMKSREVMDSRSERQVRHLANDMNFLATRVSYELDLRGPSMNVQTACSSALVAVHVAAQSLLAGECDLALAGGTAISLPQDRGYFYEEGDVLSPDGRTRAFDARARGTLFGSGAGCVVLKRLADALAGGDEVLAVLLGSAINNDGSAKIGYLAPSAEGQARVVAEALAIAGVGPETISYVEAHGTGTLVGDAIEVDALTRAFQAGTVRRGSCAIGSVKPNIGHLGEAAGIAGLIKAVLALRHRELPPSLGYEAPNPAIDFPSTPFHVETELRAWQTDGPRRAGVTALGAGGTNAHVILEEAPPPAPSGRSRSAELLVISAKTETALDAAANNLARHLREHPEQALADVAYTLQLGRQAFAHRRAIVCRDREGAVAALTAPSQGRGVAGAEERGPGSDAVHLAERWLTGAGVDWRRLHEGERRRRVPLPTYPFERRRFWIEPDDRAPPARPERRPCAEIPSSPRPSAPYEAPRDAIERELAADVRELLGVGRAGVHDDFFAIGGGSLAAVQLFERIRRRYGVDLPLSTLFEAPTIARCAEILRAEIGSRAVDRPRSCWSSLVAMQPRGTRRPFYCVAGMGGNLTNLRRLAILVGDDQPFYGLQPPGLDGRHERLYRVEELGSHYVNEILALQPEGPFLLGGYSGGGVAAFEMACQLTRRGHDIAFLGLIDSFSPCLPRRPYLDRAKIHAGRVAAEGPGYLTDLALRRLAYERKEASRRVTRALGKVLPERYRYDNIEDAWMIAEGAYTPGTFPGRATLFAAERPSAISLSTAVVVDEQHGWARFALGGVDVLPCPGDHTTLCEDPHVELLAAKLRATLDRALGARR